MPCVQSSCLSRSVNAQDARVIRSPSVAETANELGSVDILLCFTRVAGTKHATDGRGKVGLRHLGCETHFSEQRFWILVQQEVGSVCKPLCCLHGKLSMDHQSMI